MPNQPHTQGGSEGPAGSYSSKTAQPFLQYDFSLDADGAYPSGWAAEQNCEHPGLLGRTGEGAFALLFSGNKHIPLTPLLLDFTLEFTCRGDTFFSPMEILVFFRYDRFTRTGYCLKYKWGAAGAVTHCEMQAEKEYRAELCLYDGRKSTGKFTRIAQAATAGFVGDLSEFQSFRLCVSGNACRLFHNNIPVAKLADPNRVFMRPGCAAFDRGFGQGRMELGRVRIESPGLGAGRKILLPDRAVEFPPELHGILSPYVFHVGVEKWAGLRVLKIGLTGGPAQEPPPRDIHRYCFHEHMVGPYIRAERPDGSELGKYYIFRGSVGLARHHWNRDCSVMDPAGTECPLAREIALEELPAGARFFIGYEYYMGEDSITLAGGPAEALLDAGGRAVYAGRPLRPGAINLELKPAPGRKIMARIPKNIPHRADALRFAAANFFYIEPEPVRFKASVACRLEEATVKSLSAAVTLENVFREQLQKPRRHALRAARRALPAAGTERLETGWIELGGLAAGVYHVKAELFSGGLKIAETRRALEVMPAKPGAPCPPLASGLPQLYPDILSGIKNNHFYPWSRAAADIVHYNSGGNNFFYPGVSFSAFKSWRIWDLLHVYRRKWLCWSPDESLAAAADAIVTGPRRLDLWAISRYREKIVFDALLDFMRSGAFEQAAGGCLKLPELEKLPADRRGLTQPQFEELLRHHWKPWIKFFAARLSGRLIPENYRRLKAANPDCEPFQYCPVYPTYGSVYKAGYFPLYFGKDLRSGIERWLPGPNGFEDYPYSSGYAIARGIYQLASCKLECPGLRLLPEMFGVNGETRDSHVVYAHSPYGRSDPPRGFLTKQFFEYSFAAAWFDRQGFSFWRDHGYYPKTWDRENYAEMLAAYSFISRVKPARPLRTGAFVFSMAACLAHPDHFEADEDFTHGGYMMNTAEEAVAFAYEQARRAGLQAGFVVKMEDLGCLNPADLGLLVLPPLCGASGADLRTIRALHARGISLLCFEDCSGLEDLFGVAPAAGSRRITGIAAGAAGRKLIPELGALREKTSHPLCRCCYENRRADVILEGSGGAPVLTLNKTRSGQAAFFTVPPTVIRRARAKIATYGQESTSALINQATALILQRLSDNMAETTAGKIIAFEDDRGNAHVIVEEDAWPQRGGEIMPRVTVKLKGVSASDIRCTKEYALANRSRDSFTVLLKLAEHETARLRIKARRR